MRIVTAVSTLVLTAGWALGADIKVIASDDLPGTGSRSMYYFVNGTAGSVARSGWWSSSTFGYAVINDATSVLFNAIQPTNSGDPNLDSQDPFSDLTERVFRTSVDRPLSWGLEWIVQSRTQLVRGDDGNSNTFPCVPIEGTGVNATIYAQYFSDLWLGHDTADVSLYVAAKAEYDGLLGTGVFRWRISPNNSRRRTACGWGPDNFAPFSSFVPSWHERIGWWPFAYADPATNSYQLFPGSNQEIARLGDGLGVGLYTASTYAFSNYNTSAGCTLTSGYNPEIGDWVVPMVASTSIPVSPTVPMIGLYRLDWSFSPNFAPLYLVAKKGDIAYEPGSGPVQYFYDFGSASINASSQMIIAAEMHVQNWTPQQQGTQQPDFGVWLANLTEGLYGVDFPSPLCDRRPVYRGHSPLGIPYGGRIGGISPACECGGNAVLNDLGEVIAWHAVEYPEGSGAPVNAPDHGVWRYFGWEECQLSGTSSDANRELIALQGGAAPGIANGTFYQIGRAVSNKLGHVALAARVRIGETTEIRNAIYVFEQGYVAGDTTGYHLVISTGDEIDLPSGRTGVVRDADFVCLPSGGSDGRPRALNNRGQLVFTALVVVEDGDENPLNNPEARAIVAFRPSPIEVCPADLDNDGNLTNGGSPDDAVDINDLLYFLAAFEQGNNAADVTDAYGGPPDFAVDINDLLFYLMRFEAGC